MTRSRRLAAQGTGQGTAKGADSSRQKWSKVLYIRQPLPDNHTDETFLNELVLNHNVKKRTYWPVVRDSFAVTQQLDVTVFAAATYYNILRGRLAPHRLQALNGVILAVGAASRYFIGAPRALRRSVREGTVLVCGVYLLSPLFQTLTGTVSNDTIAFLVCFSLLLHLFLHDYSSQHSHTMSVTASLSIGAASFASVLLASRLSDPSHTFALIVFSLEVFLLLPNVQKDIQRASVKVHMGLTLALHVGAYPHPALSAWLERIVWRGLNLLLLDISPVLSSTHAALIILISLVCPLWLVRVQRLKRRINGPWDEATLPKRPQSASADAKSL